MNITTKRERHYIDFLPQISWSWLKPHTIYIGWLMWNIVIIL
jgi:hypothetical protein